MPKYNTPGVYIEEVSTLPPSVAEVATAIPAFIGTTAKGKAGEVEIAEISTLLDYELRFGRPRPTPFSTDALGNIVDDTGNPAPLESMPKTLLWYAMNLYFNNGGGRCYVVSVDNHDTWGEDLAPAQERFKDGLAALEREDEPTLILMPEIVALDATVFAELCVQVLAHCKKLGDRFAILDVKDGEVEASRTGYGADNLAYGAAYHPYLRTTLSHAFAEADVTIGTDAEETSTLASKASTDTALYNRIKQNLARQRVVLPPSAAIAGIYARVDRERGVWKAPANVGVMSVLGPTVQITHDQQDQLNVEPTSGKSINAIRSFAGRGTLVWGARTLAGNDNEWRYVPVRRLFIMIEESAEKATAFAVFEPNDATTWLKVKGMLESYLYGLWEQGALRGATSEAAYYVNVGPGKTMNDQDLLEGRMIVEIGVAAVRPAEFIVLRFSHKLAEA
jgi:hypothetical protein